MSLLPLGTLRERQRRAERAGKLDCAFCGLGYESFPSLAFHVANDCRFAPASVHPHGKKDRDTMANRTTTRQTNAPATRGTRQSAKRDVPFLKPDAVGHLGDQAAITFTGKNRFSGGGQYGPQMIAECTYGGKTYDFAIKPGSPNHTALQFFGGAPKPGLTVTVEVQSWDAPDGRNVEFLSIVSA